MLIRRHRARLKEFTNAREGAPNYEAGDQEKYVEEEPVPEPVNLDEEPATSEVPAGNASKADWVAYAVTQGADSEYAEGRTRDELREEYGGD